MRPHLPVAVSALLLGIASWLLEGSVALAADKEQGQPPREVVGRQPSVRVVLPVPQTLTPAGKQIQLPGLRPQAIALSPDGRLLAVSGRTSALLILDPVSGDIVQHVPLPGGKPKNPLSAVSPQRLDADTKAQLSYTGLVFSPDGRRIYLSNAEGDVKVFQVEEQGKVAGLGSLPLPPAAAPGRKAEIPAGLAVSPDGRKLYVAGNLSNTLLELEIDSGRVLRQFDVGVAPYGIVLNAGKAYVSNWGGRKHSRWKGLIPVGWYPGALAFDARRRQLCVANTKGLQAEPAEITKEPLKGKTGYNSRKFQGSVSLVPLPEGNLEKLSQTVWDNLCRGQIEESLLPPRPGQPPRAIPERIGEPSLIRHVVYIIKENRTYDQVLGDLPRGRGDPSLCIFGRSITPNQHRLASDFVLLDNTYCAGILSADGHNWSTSAFANDYLEKSFANFGVHRRPFAVPC